MSNFYTFLSINIFFSNSCWSMSTSWGPTKTWLMTGSDPRATAPRHVLSRGGSLHTRTERPSEVAKSENFALNKYLAWRRIFGSCDLTLSHLHCLDPRIEVQCHTFPPLVGLYPVLVSPSPHRRNAESPPRLQLHLLNHYQPNKLLCVSSSCWVPERWGELHVSSSHQYGRWSQPHKHPSPVMDHTNLSIQHSVWKYLLLIILTLSCRQSPSWTVVWHFYHDWLFLVDEVCFNFYFFYFFGPIYLICKRYTCH